MKLLPVILLLLFLGCARAPEEMPFSKSDVRAHAELAAWLKLWTPPLPPLTASSFRLVNDSNDFDWTIDIFSSYGPAGFPPNQVGRLEFSPDSTWAVDLWYDQVDSSGAFYRGPDTYVALVNLRGRHAFQVLTCGPDGGFHVATWVGASSFLVGGWWDSEGDGRIEPVIYRIDLQPRRVRAFEGPPIDQKYVAPLEAAVQEQWHARFQSLHWNEVE
jgi:hypothetical protein